MKRMRRSLTLTLALVLALALAPGGPGAWAEPDGESAAATAEPPIAEGTGWSLRQDGLLTLSAGVNMDCGNRSDVEWYPWMDRILAVEIGEGVTSVGNYAFCDATNLLRVSLPEGLRSIGLRAFSHCENLQALALPESVDRVDYWAFAGCDMLEAVVVGGGLTGLDNYAFQNCRSLLRVVIQAPVTRLGYDCLEGCGALKELYLPGSLEVIDQLALNGCASLSDVYYAGSAEQWERVRLEDNGDVLGGVTIHFDSPWSGDPLDVAALRPDLPRDDWVRLWGELEINYAMEDHYALVRGNVDSFKSWQAGAAPDVIRAFLEDNYDECVMLPRGYSYYDTPCHLIAKAGTSDFAPTDDLAEARRDRPEEIEAWLGELTRRMGSGEVTGYETYGGMEFAVCRRDDRADYYTLLKGHNFLLMFFNDEGCRDQRLAMEAEILGALAIHYEEKEGQAGPGPEPEPEPEPEAARRFEFMDGKLSVSIDPALYDVYLQDNRDNQAVFEGKDYSAWQAETYLKGLGYQMLAVPAGTPMLDGDWRFLLHIKAPNYPGVTSLRDVGKAQERLLCEAIVKSFGTSDWRLVEGDGADWFVFEALGSVRWATIVDERMVYLYVKSLNGPVTDEQRQALDGIMQGVRWRLG